MTNKKLQALIEEAQKALKNFPDFDALAAAQAGELWPTLKDSQKSKVKMALKTCKSSS